MNNRIDPILLRRKNILTIPRDGGHVADSTSRAMTASIIKNAEVLGYTFSKDTINVLLTYSAQDLTDFYHDLIPALRRLKGADKTYQPMYPNFPVQVMEASSAELFINAIVHYLTCGEVLPEYTKKSRMHLISGNKLTTLEVGEVEAIWEIFSNILGSKTSISPQDYEDILEIVKDSPVFYRYLPAEIPMKENAAIVAKIITENAAVKNVGAIQKYFKTATDVLRYVTAMSDGDISLASNTRFKGMKRYQRRMVMDLLAGINGDILEDMYRYHHRWLRIGEIIHPGEFTYKKYRKVNKAFDSLRNKRKPMFFGGEVQEAIKHGNPYSAAMTLMERPGEFARNLDKLIRDSNDVKRILTMFEEVANSVSTPVLIQVREHFMRRCDGKPVRVFFPKGNLAKVKYIANELPDLDKSICNAVVRICDNALRFNYAKREPLGKVYIDPEMKNFIVPFSQRSASKTLKTIVRGSRIPLNETTNVVRAFIWWTNKDNGRVDIDLSAAAYDENWQFIDHVSYTNLRSNGIRAYHSGDITNGGSVNGKGVAEFLDVDISSAAKNARYIVFQVYNYTNDNFCDLPNCRFGWMERMDMNSGEIFEPSTVEMAMDLTAQTNQAIPVIFDCVKREFIWCDLNGNVGSTRCGGNNLESNLNKTTAACYAMVNMEKPTMYDLILLNAQARGKVVNDRFDADIIFSNDQTREQKCYDVKNGEKICIFTQTTDAQIVTAYDVDYFMAQLL